MKRLILFGLVFKIAFGILKPSKWEFALLNFQPINFMPFVFHEEFLVCLGHDGRRHTYAPSHQDRINANPCDCPCDKFVTVERPSVVVMTLAFVAQSAVTSTLALTLVLSIRTTKVHLRRVVSLVFSIMVKRRSNQNLSNGGAVLSPKKRFEEDDYSREFSEWNGRAVDFRLQILGSIAPTDIKNSTRDPCPTSKQYESPAVER